MTKKRIALYLLINFGLVWSVTLLYLFCGGTYETNAMQFILIFSMLCPAIAVLVTRKVTGEGFAVTGKGSLLLGIQLNGKKWFWYAAALVLPFVYFDLGVLLFAWIFPGALDVTLLDMLPFSRKYLFLMPFAVISNGVLYSFGALGEEIGWRSYLYPKLEELYGTGKAVILGGIIWGVWHFPALLAGHNFGHGYWGEPWSGFAVFTLFTIAIGAVLFFLTQKTASVWPAVFLHAVNNAVPGGSILMLMYSEENLTGPAKQSPVRFLIWFFPAMVLGGILLVKLLAAGSQTAAPARRGRYPVR